ncbi:MAG: hypothetical protein IPO02_03035 [Bacteroidetes bacterium]|nr:hypothetical protein [Bacteroidota bacterium]
MKKSKFSHSVAAILKEFDNGKSVEEFREHSVSRATFYKWAKVWGYGSK